METMNKDVAKGEVLEYRSTSFIRKVELENRAENQTDVYELTVSSEEPYERWWGVEILDHSSNAVRLSRLNDGAAVLVDHDGDQVGVVEKAWINEDKKVKAHIRFSKGARGQEVKQDVDDGIRRNVSIGYQIHQLRLQEANEDKEIYRVTDWEPFEISVVSVPADPTVGFGRNAEAFRNKLNELRTDNVKQQTEKVNIMSDEVKKEATVNVEDVLKKERERIAEISALEKRHNLDLSEHVKKNTSIEEIRGIVLDKIGDSKPLNVPNDHVDLDNKDKKHYSPTRAIAYKLGLVSADDASLEREVNDHLEKRFGKKAKGIFIPQNLLQRDMSVGLASNYGSDLVGTDHMGSEFIDLLRNKMLAMKLGAKTLSGLNGNVSIPKWASAATAGWSATEGAGTSESTPGTSALTLSPKEISANVDYTRQLFLQSDPSIDMLIRDDLAKVLAIGIDLAVFHGSGSNGQPTGIAGTSGVGSTTISSATLVKMLGFESDIETANVESGSLAFVSTPAVKATLKGRDIGTDTGQHIVSMDNKCLGYDFHVTNQVSTGYIFFGDFSQVIIGEWGGLDLYPYITPRTGIVTLTAFKTMDIGVRQPGAFSVGSSFS